LRRGPVGIRGWLQEYDLWFKALSAVAAVVFLAQVVGSVLAYSYEATTSLLVVGLPVGSVVLFVLGFLLGRYVARRRRGASHLTRISDIKFDYLPSPPTEHGWELKVEATESRTGGQEPEFARATDSRMPGAIRIEPRGGYRLDYRVPDNESLANVIECEAKYEHNAKIYARVRMTSRDRASQQRDGWLSFAIGAGAPKCFNEGEWQVPAQEQLLEGGWVSLKLVLEDAVGRTFGREGYVYERLLTLRVRGQISLTPVTLYRIGPDSGP